MIEKGDDRVARLQFACSPRGSRAPGAGRWEPRERGVFASGLTPAPDAPAGHLQFSWEPAPRAPGVDTSEAEGAARRTRPRGRSPTKEWQPPHRGCQLHRDETEHLAQEAPPNDGVALRHGRAIGVVLALARLDVVGRPSRRLLRRLQCFSVRHYCAWNFAWRSASGYKSFERTALIGNAEVRSTGRAPTCSAQSAAFAASPPL